ncbi:translation initiation factor IF-2-like [Panicum virgatum]|uniref:translation initiation factor IF-2-like n=1 Tax=Panicum virgatum TaxID=38727 RepID=UPI0019D5527D|nr:translation initiation factor IF-2-like [Panicum virgatum]
MARCAEVAASRRTAPPLTPRLLASRCSSPAARRRPARGGREGGGPRHPPPPPPPARLLRGGSGHLRTAPPTPSSSPSRAPNGGGGRIRALTSSAGFLSSLELPPGRIRASHDGSGAPRGAASSLLAAARAELERGSDGVHGRRGRSPSLLPGRHAEVQVRTGCGGARTEEEEGRLCGGCSLPPLWRRPLPTPSTAAALLPSLLLPPRPDRGGTRGPSSSPSRHGGVRGGPMLLSGGRGGSSTAARSGRGRPAAAARAQYVVAGSTVDPPADGARRLGRVLVRGARATHASSRAPLFRSE